MSLKVLELIPPNKTEPLLYVHSENCSRLSGKLDFG